jgi:hypothetical protein
MGIAPFALANVHHILSQISGLNIKGLSVGGEMNFKAPVDGISMTGIESQLKTVKNLWLYQRAERNKHERIAATVIANKPELYILDGTQQEFSLGVSRYYKGAPHDDCPDVLAGAINRLATSPIVAEYAAAIKVLKR